MTTFSIILLVLFTITMTIFIMMAICEKNIILFILGILLNTLFFGIPIGLLESTRPDKKDVEKGDAIFVRYDYKNIKNNDTISYTIYEIEWKENK